MPLFVYWCNACAVEVRKICPPERANDEVKCRACGAAVSRQPQGASTTVYETLDNGLMPRRLERFSEAERLFKERSKAHK